MTDGSQRVRDRAFCSLGCRLEQGGSELDGWLLHPSASRGPPTNLPPLHPRPCCSGTLTKPGDPGSSEQCTIVVASECSARCQGPCPAAPSPLAAPGAVAAVSEQRMGRAARAMPRPGALNPAPTQCLTTKRAQDCREQAGSKPRAALRLPPLQTSPRALWASPLPTPSSSSSPPRAA